MSDIQNRIDGLLHNLEWATREASLMRDAVTPSADQRFSEYLSMHRRIANQRRQLAELQGAKQRETQAMAMRIAAEERAKTIKADMQRAAECNTAAAWRSIAYERMRDGESMNDLKARAMHLALHPDEIPEDHR